MFNPLKTDACLARPQRITSASAWTHHLPAAFALVQTVQPRLFVELGTHCGDSYCAFCQAVEALGTGTRCFAVDTWQGDDHSGHYGDEILAELRHYHDERYGGFSQLLRMEFDAARSLFADGSIDLLHIDGFHSYEAVRHDFETWLPALSNRGVVLFHDILVRDRDFGVWRFWEEVCQNHEHFEFPHMHGLGVLLVGKDRPPPLQEMAETARSGDAFHRLFDALGGRATLEQACARLEAALRGQEIELWRRGEQIDAEHALVEHQQAVLAEHQQQLEELRRHCQAQAAALELRERQIERLEQQLSQPALLRALRRIKGTWRKHVPVRA